jgi:prolyl 4-hydroxylase
MKLYKHNKKNNFIIGAYIDFKVCDDVIKYFNRAKKTKGVIALLDGGRGVIEKTKKSTDAPILPNTTDEKMRAYLDELAKVCELYKKQYRWCTHKHAQWGITSRFNIQKYKPTEGYYEWHFERHPEPDSIKRHLVFMTYLNDVTDGGYTQFYHQKMKVRPEKGLTLIWPAEWPWTHRGITSKTQTKYIITGWYEYLYINE